MTVAIIGYGIGNTGSVVRALRRIGSKGRVIDDPAELLGHRHAILPGVGSFHEAMLRLRDRGWEKAIGDHVQQGNGLLGICLGMQLLMSRGDEGGETKGLGLIPGNVVSLASLGCTQRIPHVGWNEVEWSDSGPLHRDGANHEDFYFVHAFAAVPDDDEHVWGTSVHGVGFASMLGSESVWGCQFHPEKSSAPGHALLSAFLEMTSC
jgi:glutamine amidotransferase